MGEVLFPLWTEEPALPGRGGVEQGVSFLALEQQEGAARGVRARLVPACLH